MGCIGVQGTDDAGIHPHRVPAFALEQGDHGIALQHRQMHSLAGILADALHVRLSAPRQVDLLEESLAEMKPACPQRVAATGSLGDVAPLDERREQMVSGGDVEAGTPGKLGQRQTAGRPGKHLDQGQCPIDRLHAAAPGPRFLGSAATCRALIQPKAAGSMCLDLALHRASGERHNQRTTCIPLRTWQVRPEPARRQRFLQG